MTDYKIQRLIDRRLYLLNYLHGKKSPPMEAEYWDIHAKLKEAGIRYVDSYSQTPEGKVTHITGTTWTHSKHS